MPKALKIFLLVLAALLLALMAIAGYVAATFDPNAYKPQIIQAVKDKTQRTLKLEGDIKLSFWPGIGGKVGKASLSERGSDKPFASVEEVRVAVKLIPLLSKQVIVDAVEVRGLRANLVRAKDGKMNFEDMTGAPAAAAKPETAPAAEPAAFDIAQVVVEDSSVSYRDEQAGTEMALSEVNLKTGRIASGVPSSLDLSLKARAAQPKLDLALKADGGFLFDLEKQHYAMDGMTLEAKGEAAGIRQLDARLSGSASARVKTGEVTAEKLALALTGVQDGNNLELKVDAPRLALIADKATGDKVTLTAKVSGPAQTVSAQAVLPGIEGTAQAFKTGPVSLDLDLKQGDLAVKAKATSPLSGNLQAKQVSLSKLALNLAASGPNLPGKSVSGELQGSAAVDGTKENVQANLAGKVGESSIKAKLAMNGFAKPAYGFDVDIDQLDLDKYLPPKAAAASKDTPAAGAGAAGPTGGAAGKEEPIDLSALKNLNATGSLRVGSLKVQNIKSSNVRLDLKARDGRVEVSPMSANLYQGRLNGSVSVNATGTPAIATRQNLTGVNIQPLLQDAAEFGNLEGKGNVSLDVTTQGATVGALKKGLNGNAALDLANGAYRGINVTEAIRKAKTAVAVVRGKPQPPMQPGSADAAQKTEFTEMKASFQIRNGVAHNEDLALRSPALRVTGAGDIDIGNDTINYLAKATVVDPTKAPAGADLNQLKGVTVPVKLSGPLDAPGYQVDMAALATEAAKQQVEQKAQDFLQRKLPGLFGK